MDHWALYTGIPIGNIVIPPADIIWAVHTKREFDPTPIKHITYIIPSTLQSDEATIIRLLPELKKFNWRDWYAIGKKKESYGLKKVTHTLYVCVNGQSPTCGRMLIMRTCNVPISVEYFLAPIDTSVDTPIDQLSQLVQSM